MSESKDVNEINSKSFPLPGLPEYVPPKPMSEDEIDSKNVYYDWGNDEDDEDNYRDDLCEGCHWCDPKSYPEAPPSIPLPEGHIISVFFTDEEEMSNDMHFKFRIFNSYESAGKAILRMYKEVRIGCKKPPLSWACKLYSPESLSELYYDEYQFKLFDDYRSKGKLDPQLFIKICKPE